MKKVLALLLAILTLTGALCACGNTADPTDNTTAAASADTQDTTAGSADTERITPNVGDVNYDGHIFRVLTRGQYSETWYSRDIFSEGITGDVIGDAVYTRNSRMETKYGFTVEEVGSKNPATDAVSAVSSGDDIYDMFCFKVQADITGLLLKGYLKNLNHVDKMNLDMPYYDQNSRKAFSIANKLYLVTGDMLTMDNDSTRCCMFNKVLFSNLNIANEIGGTLYQKVADKTWTVDVFTQCAKIATSDLNGDGVWDLSDQYGMVSEQFNVLALYNASGRLTYEKDKDDIPYFAANTADSLDIFSKMVTLLNGEYCRHYTNAYNEAIPQFKEGLILFYVPQLADVPLLREMDFDFGILPLPMYNTDQDGYHSPVTTYGCNCIAIPSSVKDVDRAATIIEVLSCESMYELTPAYYDLNLKTRLARDVDSSPCIDIILGTAVFDLGYMWKWGGIYDAICTAFKNNNPDMASSLTTVAKAGKKEIERDIKTIRNIND